MEGLWFRRRSEVGEYPPKIAGLIDKLRQLKRQAARLRALVGAYATLGRSTPCSITHPGW